MPEKRKKLHLAMLWPNLSGCGKAGEVTLDTDVFLDSDRKCLACQKAYDRESEIHED